MYCRSQTPPRDRRHPRHESGLGSSGDEVGSESEGSVIDDGELLEEPAQTETPRLPSTFRKSSDVSTKPSPLSLLERSELVRSTSESGESGVAESPVVDGPTDDYVTPTNSEVVVRQRRHHISSKQRKEWKQKRRSIKDLVRELKL